MADSGLRGSLRLSIGSQGLVATGIFNSNPDGAPVTLRSVLDLLRENRVVNGYSEKKITEQLNNLLPEPPETAELILAKGIPPTQARAETAQFESAPIPEKYLEHAERVLAAAGSPDIYIEKTERVPVEKIVKKKSSIPFAPAKEEVIQTTETRIRKERVYVDPKVLGQGYIYNGDKIGTLLAGEEGVSGWNIHDEEIPPIQHGDPHFYLGNGLERKGTDIIAVQDGVLRYGSHWAEVLAFVPHSYTLTLSPDKASCLLNFFPGEPAVALPTEEDIRREIAMLNYPEELLMDFEDIFRLMRQSVQTQQAIENIPLSVSRDASFDITVSEDKMTALLQAHKGRGKGKPLRLKEIGIAIKQSKLVGLDFQQIKEDLLEFYVSRETDMTGYVLAEGTPPEEGPERETTFSTHFFDEKEHNAILHQLKEHPESTKNIESIEDFPMDAVEEMAPVELEQRVIVLSPPEPGAAGKDVYGKALSGLPGKPITLSLHENLVEKGNVIIASEKGILDKGEIEGTTHLRVRPHKDAEVLVEISPDGMKAFISMFGSVGSGRPLTEEMVYQAVNEAKVVQGLKNELLQQSIEQAQNGDVVQSVLIAQGKHPISGGETKLDFVVHVASGKGVSLRQDGTADFRNQDNITRVTADELLAVMMPPTVAPEDGFTVTGRSIAAPKNTENQLVIDDSIRQEPQKDGTVRLFAAIDGELSYENNSLAIKSTHTVKGDICMDTGNIKFPGTVQITGSVLSGFYVVSGGDVMIGGAVEAALVSADGVVKIVQGIKGAKKAVVRSKKNIQTMFAEQSTILAVDDVQIKNSIMHCRIKTNGMLQLYQDKSTILGGISRARNGIYTSNLGSPRGIKTTVSFGQDYLIGDKIEQEEKEIDKIKKTIAEVDLSMQSRENRNNQHALEGLRKKKVIALKAMEKRGLRLFSLRERFEEHFASEIVVKGTVFPGVTVESHGRTLEITTERKNVTFRFDPQSGHITEESNTKE